MTEEQFWDIIQRSNESSGGEQEEQCMALAEELEGLSADEVVSFDKLFARLQATACTWELWGAASIIQGGCSDDEFVDFRSWLISRGREWYDRALDDPDSLADYPADLEETGVIFEEIAYVASQVYEDKTGNEPNYDLPEDPNEPEGEPWDEDDEDTFKERWPKLFKKYGDE